MGRTRFAVIAGTVLLAASAALHAQNAYTTRIANLRAGPDGSYPLVGVIDAGAPVDVQGCLSDWSWCDVIFDDTRGWVYAPSLAYVYEGARVPFYSYAPTFGLPIITFSLGTYWDRYYRGRPWYEQRREWERRHIPHRRPPGPPPRAGRLPNVGPSPRRTSPYIGPGRGVVPPRGEPERRGEAQRRGEPQTRGSPERRGEQQNAPERFGRGSRGGGSGAPQGGTQGGPGPEATPRTVVPQRGATPPRTEPPARIVPQQRGVPSQRGAPVQRGAPPTRVQPRAQGRPQGPTERGTRGERAPGARENSRRDEKPRQEQR